MKLLINSDIHKSQSNSLTDSNKEILDRFGYLQDASGVLNKYSVSHILKIFDSHWDILIYAQKVCLDDIDMNTLFCDGFDIPLNIEYSPLGGVGCEFAIRMTGVEKMNEPVSKYHELAMQVDPELRGSPAQEPVMIYHGRCHIDCGEHGHHDMEMLKLIPAGTKLYTHPATSQKPVAWMWKFDYDDGASFTTHEPTLSIRDGVNYVPLYQVPPDAAAQIADIAKVRDDLMQDNFEMVEQIAKLEAELAKREVLQGIAQGFIGLGRGRKVNAEKRELLVAMEGRFLGWKLPKDFAPDGYISFDREGANLAPEYSWPIGTNLLTGPQAMNMLDYVTAPLQEAVRTRELVLADKTEQIAKLTEAAELMVKALEAQPVETVTKWKDGIDIDVPNLAGRLRNKALAAWRELK